MKKREKLDRQAEEADTKKTQEVANKQEKITEEDDDDEEESMQEVEVGTKKRAEKAGKMQAKANAKREATAAKEAQAAESLAKAQESREKQAATAAAKKQRLHGVQKAKEAKQKTKVEAEAKKDGAKALNDRRNEIKNKEKEVQIKGNENESAKKKYAMAEKRHTEAENKRGEISQKKQSAKAAANRVKRIQEQKKAEAAAKKESAVVAKKEADELAKKTAVAASKVAEEATQKTKMGKSDRQKKRNEENTIHKMLSACAASGLKMKQLEAALLKLEADARRKDAASASQKSSERSTKDKLGRAKRRARDIEHQLKFADLSKVKAAKRVAMLKSKVKQDEKAEVKQNRKTKAATKLKEAATKSKEAALAKMVEEKAQKAASAHARAGLQREVAKKNKSKALVNAAHRMSKKRKTLVSLANERQRKIEATKKRLAKLKKAASRQAEDEQALKWKAKADEVKMKKDTLKTAAQHHMPKKAKKTTKKNAKKKKAKKPTKAKKKKKAKKPKAHWSSKAAKALAVLHAKLSQGMSGRRRNFNRNDGIGRQELGLLVKRRTEQVIERAAPVHNKKGAPKEQHADPLSPSHVKKQTEEPPMPRSNKPQAAASSPTPAKRQQVKNPKAHRQLAGHEKAELEREVKSALSKGMKKLLGPTSLEIAAGLAEKKVGSKTKHRTTDESLSNGAKLGEGNTLPGEGDALFIRRGLRKDDDLFEDADVASDGVPLELGTGSRSA